MTKTIKFTTPEIHKKGWGEEEWIYNGEEYCGKILTFYRKGSKFSFHYHLLKTETWYVFKGGFDLKYLDLATGEEKKSVLIEGSVIHIPPGHPHQLIALVDDSKIFEISTQHYEEDSYRIAPGHSQNITL